MSADNSHAERKIASRRTLATVGVEFYDRMREYENADYHARQAAIAYVNRKAPDLEYAECAELLADALAARVAARD